MIRKLATGTNSVRLFAQGRSKDRPTAHHLGTFEHSPPRAEQHEREVQYFKRHG